jgi:branched-chain amino acid transport system substrate-binding protein
MLKRLIFVVMVASLLLPVSATAKEVTGVTDTEVVLGWTTPLSGPAALWGVTALGGMAYASYINDQGGIHGRKIKVILKDDGYNPARALANLQEMKGKVFAVTGLLGTAVVQTSRDFFAENDVPLITAYGNTRMFVDYPKDKLRYIFISYPDYEDEADFLSTYAFENLGSKKFAIFYQNDDYGKLGLEGLKRGLAKLSGKAELAGAVSYDVTERALGTHALKLKESGADTLLLYPTMTHGALILKEMAKIGYRPKVLASFPLGDPIMYKVAGELWEGVYPASPANSGIPGEVEADRVIEILKKYNPKIEGKEYLALFGSISMMHAVEGLRNAGKKLTPKRMIRGMEKIKNWKPEGVGGPVTYGRKRHHGVNGSRVMKAERGNHVAITDYVIYKPRF